MRRTTIAKRIGRFCSSSKFRRVAAASSYRMAAARLLLVWIMASVFVLLMAAPGWA